MAAVFRVKRKRASEIADAFYISCKKSKTDEPDENSPILFKYGGSTDLVNSDTLFSQVNNNFQNTSSKKVSSDSKRKYQSVGEKNTISVKKSLIDDKICVYDILENQKLEKSTESSGITCNGVDMLKSKKEVTDANEEEYVYDIYFANKSFDINLINEELIIEKQKEIFFYDDYRGDSESSNESEDSNAEENWRNDYPDEDSHFYDRNSSENSCDDIDFDRLAISRRTECEGEFDPDEGYYLSNSDI